jgi:hypothetical protein
MPVDGVRFLVKFAAALTFFGMGPYNEKEVSIVALNAVVATHGEEHQREHEDILPLPT